MAANNGKKPEGDMGAYEKARKAWQDSTKKEREDRKGNPHLKSMIANKNDEERVNTEDEDSSDDDALFCAMRVKPIHKSKPTSTTNHFAALTSWRMMLRTVPMRILQRSSTRGRTRSW